VKGLISFIARRPGLVSLSLVIVTAFALIPASRLQLSTDLPALLPDDSPAATAYREFLDHFGAAETVFITIEGRKIQTGEALTGGLLAEATSQIAEELEARPDVARARAGLDAADETFFLADIIERAPLFLDGPEWEDEVRRRLAPTAIKRRVAMIRAASLAPGGTARTTILEHDPLGFSDALDFTTLSDFGLEIDPSTMAFLSPGGKKVLIVLDPAASELNPRAGRILAGAIQEITAEIAKEMELSLSSDAVGGPLFAAHDEAVIRTDVQKTLPITALACALLLVGAFSGIGIPLAGLVALGAALVWLAAGLALGRGDVSMVVIGFVAVLIGMGIDTAIHGGTALRRYSLAGLGRVEAALKAVEDVGPAVVTATLTTAAAFGVLALSDLPPLRELGWVIAFGMVAVLAATTTLGLASALLFSRFFGQGGAVWAGIGRLVNRVVSLAEAWPQTVVMISALGAIAAGTQIIHIQIQPDLNRLRPTDHPVVAAGRRLATAFGIGEDTATLLVTGDDLDQALMYAKNARKIVQGSYPDIRIISPDRRVMGPQLVSERLQALQQFPWGEAVIHLRHELVSAGLRPQAFSDGLAALDSLSQGRDPHPLRSITDDQITTNDAGQTIAALSLRLPKGLWSQGPPPALRHAVEEVAPGALFASMSWVGADLKRLAARDFRRLSGLSLALILLVVGLSFRGRPTPTFLALTPVILGTLWAFGLWGAMGRSLDLFGLAVLPVMLGLGIDDGLYSVHGAGRRGVIGIGPAIRDSGRAMVLTTLTTAIAFSSLGLSHLPALRAAALLVPLAVLACLVATLAVLPAIATLVGPSKTRTERE
jgi:predicted RND superfamily exporter protein